MGYSSDYHKAFMHYLNRLRQIILMGILNCRACIKILKLDSKKDFDAKVATIDFRIKKISIANVRPEILTEIQKFSFPIQKLIAEEAHAVLKRLQEEKKVPNLKTAGCSCKFFTHYMLPCRHIFHEQLCGDSNILTSELVEIPPIQRSDAKKNVEKSKQIMNELFERTKDQYYRLAEKT
ncbi:5329_t:CDS:2 [Gigaspora rosea]|nr:5329_t:CDS:2 [Gigaspora rosea]